MKIDENRWKIIKDTITGHLIYWKDSRAWTMKEHFIQYPDIMTFETVSNWKDIENINLDDPKRIKRLLRIRNKWDKEDNNYYDN